jgi:predicted transcriptional regulator
MPLDFSRKIRYDAFYMQTTYTVPAGVTARLDIWLVDQMAITRAQVQKLIKADLILVNDVLPKKERRHGF